MDWLTYDELKDTLKSLNQPYELKTSRWMQTCLAQTRSQTQPTDILTVKKILTDALIILRREDAEAAEILYKRFIEGIQVQDVVEENFLGRRSVLDKQKMGIIRLVGLLQEQEIRCQQSVHIDCGEQRHDLQYMRSAISQRFGSYFTSLFEMENQYIQLAEQLEHRVSPELALLPPLLQLQHELRKPQGARTLFIAGAGGMGKTSLTVRLLKCLLEENDADLILGDSAKEHRINVPTGRLELLQGWFNNPLSFYQRLSDQVGLPPSSGNPELKAVVRDIRSRLQDNNYRAVIVVDNLDSLSSDDAEQLTTLLSPLLGRDCRAIITSRTLEHLPDHALRVNINPLTTVESVQRFLNWHIEQYAHQVPFLSNLQLEFTPERLARIVEVTGGIPLVMQLVISQVARQSWDYLHRRVTLSTDVLDFLYAQHWQNFRDADAVGTVAMRLSAHIATQQRYGQRVTRQSLDNWADTHDFPQMPEALDTLLQRFLIINRDRIRGDFVTFPSYVEFVKRHV